MRVIGNRNRVVGLSGLLLLSFAVIGCSGSAKTAGTGVVADSATTSSSNTGTDPGTATLSWAAPTENTDGSSVTDLAGYRIYYGTSPSDMTQSIYVAGATVTTYVVNGLSSGTYYFAVAADSTTGVESMLSDTASKTI
jgi:hypothetical protein